MLAVMSSFTSPVILDDSSSNSDTDDTHLVISDDSPTCIIVPDSPVKVVTTKQCRKIVAEMNVNVPIKEEDPDMFSVNPVCMPSKRFKRELTFNHGNLKQPIYDSQPTKYLAEDIFRLLLDTELDSKLICSEKPTSVSSSAAFIVDLTSLSDADDIKRDSYGKWKYSGSRPHFYFIKHLDNNQMKIEKREPGVSGDNIFQIRRLYCKHPSNDDFRRMIAIITDNQGNPHPLCLVVYYLPDGFEPIIRGHRNSKDKSKEFHTTWSSTKKLIASTAVTHGPKSTISKIHSSMGGILSSKCPGHLPRNERQIVHVKRTLKASSSGCPDSNDDLYTVMFRAINEETAFVRQIKVLPEPAIILSSDYQLYDIHRFCTDPSSNCILTIDPTFSLGAFDVTPTTYRHLLLESQRYRTFPVCVGPVMIHYKKSFSTYHFFASSLVGLNRDISHLVAFGTDGELALSEAFSCVFPNALHLSCTIHARRNIMDKLKDLKFSDSLSRSVLNDIFGNRSSDTYVEGLIDAVDGADFDNRFLRLETSWSKQEKSDVGTDEFVPWFQRYKLDHFKKTMIGSVRKAAGLLPTEHFSTNASEAVNMILKSKMNYKKSDLPYLVSQIKELVFEQLEELDNALLNRGKFSVKSSYQDLVVGESSWHNMSEQQRLAHIERFHNTTPINQCDSSEAIRSSSLSNSINSPTLSELSIGPSFATKCTSVSDDVILGIWTKAAKLVATKGAIAEAPGCSSLARNVISKSKSGFHTVKPGKNNRFVCDCPHYLSIKICAHSVATAEVNNLLPQFLKTVKPVRPNITKLVTGNMPKGRGRKGTKPPRKRTSLPPITSTINPFKTQISACSNTAHAKASSSSTSSSPPPLPPPIVSPSQSCEPPLYPSSTSSSPPPLTPPIVSPSQSCEPPLYPSSTSSSPPPLPPLIVSPFQSCEPPHYPSPSTSSNLAPIYYPQTLSYPSFLPPFSSPSGYLPYPPLSSYPPSSHQTIGQFNIVFIQGNISVCQGCNNKYQKPPLPPHDICLQHLEWREFIPQGSQTTRSKWGNAYYHCHPSCVLSRWPMFTSSLLNIDLSVAQRLLPLHKSYLCRHFGLSLP